MGIGHTRAAQMAYRDGAYGVFLTPDLMFSDGTVASIQRHARAGVQLVLAAALRFGEEPLFQNLTAMGVLGDGRSRAQSGQPLAVTGRQMVAAGLRSFHSETLRYEWEAPYFAEFPNACWWRVPGEDGIILHSLSWVPVLFDYTAVGRHDTTTLEQWTIDGDYVHRNLGDDPRVHVVADSDEIMLVSWASLADRPYSLMANPIKMFPVVGPLFKGGLLRAALLSGIFDRLKLRMFFLPVRWHAGEITLGWKDIEARAAGVLRKYVGDLEATSGCGDEYRGGPTPVPSVLRRALWKPFIATLLLVVRIWMVAILLRRHRSRLAARAQAALHGDREAWRRIFRRVGVCLRMIRGVPVNHP
jgi:hypothetical protein